MPGLYRPPVATPVRPTAPSWSSDKESERPWRNTCNPAFNGVRREADLANAGGNGRMVRALASRHELDGDPRWEAAGCRIVIPDMLDMISYFG